MSFDQIGGYEIFLDSNPRQAEESINAVAKIDWLYYGVI
jgi:hypothetical protein